MIRTIIDSTFDSPWTVEQQGLVLVLPQGPERALVNVGGPGTAGRCTRSPGRESVSGVGP